jgi:capsular exopolysaccharide synthesis family protein
MTRIHAALQRFLADQNAQDGTGKPVSQASPGDGSDVLSLAPWFAGKHEGHVDPSEERGNEDGAADQTGEASASRAPFETSAKGVFHEFSREASEKLVAGHPPHRERTLIVATEQYRKLGAALHHAQLQRKLEVLMVTSTRAREGKSLSAANLALTLSESFERRVLLIDADLRRPALHEIFQVPNVSGLSDGLKQRNVRRVPIIQVSDRLSVLPAGHPDPNPMGGLTSPQMAQILAEGRERFDWTIVDTPPIGLLSDAKLLSSVADAAVFVVQAGKTPYTEVVSAIEAIGRDHILGVVLNRFEDVGLTYYYHYDRYYTRDSQKHGR